MEKSDHRNFVELYWRNRDAIIQNDILPYQKAIFNLFSAKFEYDAKKDLEKWRKKLSYLGEKCANEFREIHLILKWENFDDNDEDEIFNLIQNIINMDYWSVEEFFNTLKENYKDNPKIYNMLDNICNDISEMRRISKKHTNIISK